MTTLRRMARGLFWSLAAGMVCVGFPARALLPFPLTAGQVGFVTCLEKTNDTYECYLPPNYSTNGSGLPIIYVFNPNGGPMPSAFATTCQFYNCIGICVTNVHNNRSWDLVLEAMYAVSRDVRTRVLYDPSQEFAGGFSGGGECSYMFARLRAQHVTGVIDCDGTIGRGNNGGPSVQYYGIDRVQTNLFITRTTGSSDEAAQFYDPFDSNFLATCQVTIQDYTFSGGHTYPPNSLLETCLGQLIAHHTAPGPNDQQNALMLYTNWQARIAAGDGNSVLRECVSNLMNFPRTWFAYQAQLTLDQLLADYSDFSKYDVSNLAQGDFAQDLFYYYARGAANAGDTNRYYSCLRALTGVTATNDYDGTNIISGIVVPVLYPTTNGTDYIVTVTDDHAVDVEDLEGFHGYGNPWLQFSTAPSGNSMTLTLLKSAPWLQYSLKGTSNPVNGPWSDALFFNTTETRTIWSSTVYIPAGAGNGCYRLLTLAGGPLYSPYWPYWTAQ